MPKNTRTATSDLFPNPDSDIQELIPAIKKRAAKLTSSGKKTPKSSPGQAYLPGLSRRGRPRKPDAAAPTERAAESRKKRMDAGVKRIELMVEPVVATALDALTMHFKESRVELVSRLLTQAARRFLK